MSHSSECKYKPGLVSIITPTYNRAHYLKYAIDSVLAQTYTEFELIIIDDGSTDATATLVEPYLSDSRFKYIKTSNQGQALARNTGLEHAKGEYISFLDSDDRWFADKLEKSVNTLKNNSQFDILYADRLTIDGVGEGSVTSSYNIKRYSGRISKYLLRDNCVSFSTTLVRHMCFDEMGGFNPEDRLNEDYDLWLRFSTQYQFYYLRDNLSFYRVSDGQVSDNAEDRLLANEALLNEFIAKHVNLLSQKDIKQGWCYFYTRKGNYHSRNGNFKEAFLSYIKALSFTVFLTYPWKSLIKLVIFRKNRQVKD